MSKVRRGARWALGVGASLFAMAGMGGACAEVRSIDLDSCSTTCLPPTTDDAAAAEDESAGDITLSLLGAGRTESAADARPDLIFDPKALPPVLVGGLPSPIVDVAAQTLDSEGVSPYDFFAEVIDIPYSADARAFNAVSFFLSTPSLTGQLRDFLWASNEFFGPPSGTLASHRAIPLSADADALYGALTNRSRGMPTPSPSSLSEPPSSGAAEPVGEVWDKAVRAAGFSSDGADSNK
jgi:hypothetical protein